MKFITISKIRNETLKIFRGMLTHQPKYED